MHELPRILIDIVLDFPQYELDVYVFMHLPLGIIFDGNRGEWVLKLNKSLFGLNQASESWFDL